MNPKAYPLPTVPLNESGQTRKVGFELEFSGISINDAYKVLEKFGATSNEGSAVEAVFSHELGDFKLELDASYIKKIAKDQGYSSGDSTWFDLLTQVASLVVPVEIVCPPIPADQLQKLNPLVAALREAGARGTDESPFAAYGIHINTEAPDLSCQTLYRYLLAFCLLQWWLVESHQVDFTRRLSPFVDLFPESYVLHLIEHGTPNNTAELISSYIKHNPTRNRALDMLPIFSWVEEKLVNSQLDNKLIKKRPAFHYRLPNCHIERPSWSLGEEWLRWLEVENLASQPKRLEELAKIYRDNHQFLLGVNRKNWIERIEKWRQDLSSA